MEPPNQVGGEPTVLLLTNQTLIKVLGHTFIMESGDRLPEAKGISPVFQVLADWGNIDARFNQIRIFDFKPVEPTNQQERTLIRGQGFIATFAFPKATDPSGTGVKFAIEYSGDSTDKVTIDPGFILKP